MQLRSFNAYFFFLILLIVGTVVFFIFQPFLTAIVAASILATLFKRPYNKFEKWTKGRRAWSALLTCLLAIVIIVTPVFLALSFAIVEANNLYHALGEQSALEKTINQAVETVRSLPYIDVFFDVQTLNQENILNDIRQFGQNALGLLRAVYQGVTHFVLWVFVMFFTLFYFLIDGKRLLKYLMMLSPLRNEHDQLLIEKFTSISRATLKGTIVVGVIQGILGGIVFWIAGIPSPAIWGIAMTFFSIIPMVGTAIVWIPMGVVMLLLGNIWQGIFILSLGASVISIIDNILRPKLVGRDTEMHPLMVFFATLGGISFFGLPGFIIGPIIVSLFLALGEIYTVEFRDQLNEYNHD
jgi:predicted PurR-regulated permease PerM